MTFDEQLTHAFAALTDRLRADIDRQVHATVDEVSAAARADREAASAEAREVTIREAASGHDRALALARQEAEEQGLATGREQGHSQGFDAGRRQGIEEGRREAEQAPRPPIVDHSLAERLVESVTVIGRAGSLSEVLDVLLQRSAQEARQAAVWLVRGGTLREWRASSGEPSGVEVPITAETAVAEAARSKATVNSDEGYALPIALSGEVVAVLFAANPANAAAIEVLTRYAARCLEALTAFKAARASADRPGASALPGRN
ncbi:MAG TPA: hypothetical protein VM140_06925 [Burkholderiales bacterium]|nr:hypothetical protein [Burkholderiales bacterium]